MLTHVLAVKREQVEAVRGSPSPAIIDHHALAVDGGGRDREGADGLDDQRHAVGPILGVAREHPERGRRRARR